MRNRDINIAILAAKIEFAAKHIKDYDEFQKEYYLDCIIDMCQNIIKLLEVEDKEEELITK